MIGNRAVTCSSFQSLALERETAQSGFPGTTEVVFTKIMLLVFLLRCHRFLSTLSNHSFLNFEVIFGTLDDEARLDLKHHFFFLNFIQMETSVRLVLKLSF